MRLLARDDPKTETWRRVHGSPLRTPSGRLTLGEADSELIHPAHPEWTTVTVSVPADLPDSDNTAPALLQPMRGYVRA